MRFGELQDEVPGMSDEPPADLEEPLLDARQGPTLDSERQDQPAQQIAEIVGDDAQEEPHLISPEPMTGEAGPAGGGFALLDPLLLLVQHRSRHPPGLGCRRRQDGVLPLTSPRSATATRERELPPRVPTSRAFPMRSASLALGSHRGAPRLTLTSTTVADGVPVLKLASTAPVVRSNL